jgi:predicted acyl esterase
MNKLVFHLILIRSIVATVAGPLKSQQTFDAAKIIRIEVSSSHFPRFARNLNTGGNIYDEARGVVARNTVHHSREYPPQIRLPIVER